VTDEVLDHESRRRLLEVARRAIGACLAGQPLPKPVDLPGVTARGGAFVTLKRRGSHELRACVGYLEAGLPAVETVSRAAAGACRDERFAPMGPAELAELRIEISLLGPLRPIAPEDVQVGVHGLLLRSRGRSGLLLPQVPVEHGWDRQTFLDHTCLKAGLPPGSWRAPKAELLGFTAVVFGEE